MSYIIGEYIRRMQYIMERPNIEDDAYNNVLLIQKCIQNLNNNNAFSPMEKDILKAVALGYNYAEISKLLRIDQQTVSRTFKRTTDRIAYVLGGEFTDVALFDRMGSLANLTKQESSNLARRGFLQRSEYEQDTNY